MSNLKRRIASAFSGEGAQSAAHFILNIYVLSGSQPADYATYALAILCAGISISYISALGATPTQVHLIHLTGDTLEVTRNGINLVSYTWCLLFAGSLAAAISLINPNAHGILWSCALVALWPVRVYMRAHCYAARNAKAAFFSDIIYTASLAVICLSLYSNLQFDTALAGMCIANVISIIYLALILRANLSVGADLFRSVAAYMPIWSDSKWSTMGVTVTNIQGYIYAPIVLLSSGTTVYAAIAACSTLLGPIRIATGALQNVIRVDFSDYYRVKDYGRARSLIVRTMLLVLAACLFLGIAILLSLQLIQEHLLSDYRDLPTGPMLMLAWGAASLFAVRGVPSVALQAAKEFKALTGSITLGAGISTVGALALVQAGWSALTNFSGVCSEAACLVHQLGLSRRVFSATGEQSK